MSLKRRRGQPLTYAGKVTQAFCWSFDRAPTENDYHNFERGDFWIHIIGPGFPFTYDLWQLADKKRSRAQWIKFGGSGGELITLTADVGGAVSPDANNNINILGGISIVTVGDPPNNAITIDADGDLANQYFTDAGIAIPVANILNVLGGNNVNTAGAGSTITINADGALADEYVTDAGTAVPVAGTLNVLGGAGIATSGAGNTVTISTADTAAFFAYVSIPILNVTGAGASYIIIFDTEKFDIGANYNPATGQFTAPVDGIYQFNTTVSVRDTSAGMDDGGLFLSIAGSGPNTGTTGLVTNDVLTVKASSTDMWRFGGGATVQMDSGDVARISIRITGGAGDTADIYTCLGGGTDACSWFSGVKIANV